MTTAHDIIDQIGRDTFDPDALDLVTLDGTTAAIPIHGYQQLLIYRADWFEQRNLPPPNNYNSLMTAAETFFDRENLTTGIVIPTESNLFTTHKAFEHIAIANRCQLIDNRGEVKLLEPTCQEAIDFYFNIVNQYSPIGVQTDTSTQNAYLAGRTAMIITTPSILPHLAGIGQPLPTCPECSPSSAAGAANYLAANSSIITQFSGNSAQTAPANFGNVTYVGITREANTELATAFARFWFNEGYATWLAIESERKVPMHWGTASNPRQFIDNWGIIPLTGSDLSLTDIYGETTVATLRDNIASSRRWGFVQNQGTLITELHENLTLSIVLQETLSGYFDTNQTILEATLRVVDLIPDYQFTLEPTPTPEG